MNKINETNASPTEATTAPRGRKSAAYSSPKLVAYGCVSALTQSGVGSRDENTGKDPQPNKRP